ncbi:MAG: competence/damage-inducible protein A [Chlamydiae bacterium]|nr:competence/damage-inducible protein A [Chlamydiota bacterium]MBI3276484.1 competence/damage-inducible protein A [Chlamydiota bacterium]
MTIATGTELMLGSTRDEDFVFMASRLAEKGCPIYRHYVVGDDLKSLKTVFSEALFHGDIVILSGGLGPTTDDLTRAMASEVLNRSLKINHQVLQAIEEKFRLRHLELPECSREQALILEGAEVIPNFVGTAPGMYLKDQDKDIFFLPGPPYELKPMFDKNVLPKILSICQTRMKSFTVKTFGVLESSVQTWMSELFKSEPAFLKSLGYTSSPEGVSVRVLEGEDRWKEIQLLVEKLKKRLGPWTYGQDQETLPRVVAKLLREEKKTLAIAESCTGGLMAERLTQIPGISEVFKLGVVTYSNDAKMNLIGVSKENLERWGAVSEAVVLEMAQGVREKGYTDLGLSITGVAGPDGGTSEKPVGLVWIGMSDGVKSFAQSYQFFGDRPTIQFKASQAAFDLLRRSLA